MHVYIILEAYAWRSILQGVAAIKKGIIWRIGNGESISIWSAHWIPWSRSRKVISRRGN
jgi:hypothetical protein